MKSSPISMLQQPMVVKYVQSNRNGIQSYGLNRYGIGYLVRGKKYIYYGDTRHEVNQGDIFYLGTGNHYTEDVPDGTKAFEQIMFYYTPDQLSRILNNLSLHYRMIISNDHSCENCRNQSHVVFPAWNSLKGYFNSVGHYLKEDLFSRDPNQTGEQLKLTELIYMILMQPDCCLKTKILGNIDLMKESFEQIVQNLSSPIFRSKNWPRNATGASPRSKKSSGSIFTSRPTNGSSSNG